MSTICIIGDSKELNKNQAMFSELSYELRSIPMDQLAKVTIEEDLAVVFPWEGFRDLFESPQFKTLLAQRAIVVIGPSSFFYDVEDWVIDGSVCFVSVPASSKLIATVIEETLRLRGEQERHSVGEPTAA